MGTRVGELQRLQVCYQVGLFLIGQLIGEWGHALLASLVEEIEDIRIRDLLLIYQLGFLVQALQTRTHLALRAVGVVTDAAVLLEDVLSLLRATGSEGANART